MNRRGFLQAILRAGVAAAILPSALTYKRKWKQVESLIVPEDSFHAAWMEHAQAWVIISPAIRFEPDGTGRLVRWERWQMNPKTKLFEKTVTHESIY